jgi:hypothetical protein
MPKHRRDQIMVVTADGTMKSPKLAADDKQDAADSKPQNRELDVAGRSVSCYDSGLAYWTRLSPDARLKVPVVRCITS